MIKLPIGVVTLRGDKQVSVGTNQTQYGFGEGLCVALADQSSPHAIRGMYIEFENVASPGDAVSPPVGFGRDEGTEYYDSLSSSLDRDYLRIPLAATPVADLDPDYEGGEVNRLKFIARTSGGTGVHGKTFAAGSNSKIFGVAIVIVPDWDDPSQDIVVGRKYYENAEQQIVAANGQTYVDYAQTYP